MGWFQTFHGSVRIDLSLAILLGLWILTPALDGVLAQLVERLVRNEKVRSSSLLGSTILHTVGFPPGTGFLFLFVAAPVPQNRSQV